MLEASRQYTQRNKGKKPAEHKQGEPDLWRFAALVMGLIPLAGEAEKVVMQRFADSMMQHLVKHCRFVKAFKSTHKKLELNLDHSLAELQSAIDKTMAVIGFPKLPGKDAKGAVQKEIEELRKDIYGK